MSEPGEFVEWVQVHPDQWERLAAVVRAAAFYDKDYGTTLRDAIDALTPDDIEAVQG